MNGPIALLMQPGDSSNIVYNALVTSFDIVGIVMESELPRRTLLSRRLKTLGLRTVLGQVAFRSIIVPPLSRASQDRIRKICADHGLSRAPIPERLITRVESVNSEQARSALRTLAPQVVVVNGTRIISKQTLSCISAPFVNTHTGITPLYRGVHGGYWALAQNDHEHCGVTVHLVDPGIDTGGILGQSTISPTAQDNFVTYPYLQYAAAVPILRSSVAALLGGSASKQSSPDGVSKLWSHPTLGQYIRNRLVQGTR